MTPSDILSLLKNLSTEEQAKLIETHISWVILTHEFAYKFKKPMRYSFLNYSRLQRRKFYCEREVELNSRFSDIYLDIVPVYREKNSVQLGKGSQLIDYGVKMLKLDGDFQMNRMIKKNRVTTQQMSKLARKIAEFHQNAEVIRGGFSSRDLSQKFNDIRVIKPFLHKEVGLLAEERINEAILESNHFIDRKIALFKNRVKGGFVKDLHGDLHSKNIFLYKDPILFDCIEFNDAFRKLDILDELAFLCMDLEAREREDLSVSFLKAYLEISPVIRNYDEDLLFTYYKCYRANVRAKVNALRAKQTKDTSERTFFLKEVSKYLSLMSKYKNQFSRNTSIDTSQVLTEQNHPSV